MITNTLIIGAAGLALLSYFKGKKSATDEYDTSGDTLKDAKKEVIQKDLSKTASWYSQTADSIQSSLLTVYKSRVLFIGDDGNKAIHDVLIKLTSLKSKSDWLNLLSKFGKRSGVSASVITNEPLNKWLIHFLEDKSYKFNGADGKEKSVNALTGARHILNKIKVSL